MRLVQFVCGRSVVQKEDGGATRNIRQVTESV